MAFLGADKGVIQYSAPIGPLPGSGNPMKSHVIIGAASIAAATVVNPLLGLLVAGIVIAQKK